jgi:protein-tyrosine phosphatase
MRIRELTPQLLVTSNLHRVELSALLVALRPVDMVVSLVGREIPEVRERVELYTVYPIPDAGLSLAAEVRLNELADDAATVIALGGKVLINCNAGRNRSCLLAALTLTKLNGWSGEQAMAFVRERRPNALANPMFEKYLRSV